MTLEARQLALSIKEYSKCEEKYLLTDVDAELKAIADGIKNPKICNLIENINKELAEKNMVSKH